MRKYLYTFKSSFIESFNYVPAILFKFISFLISMFIMYSIWGYIYQDKSQIINNFNLAQMMWYLLISEIFTYGQGPIATSEMTKDIRNGNIAYNINKPYNYVFYVLTRHLADGTIRVFLFSITCIIIGFLFVGPIPNFSIVYFPFMLITALLGYVINSLIKILIGMSSFWTEESAPFHWIYNKILLIFGVFFPIDMFPKWLRPVLLYTPVYTVIYGPVMLIIKFSYSLFIKVLFAQFIYLIIVLILLVIVYRKGVKKLNVNGG